MKKTSNLCATPCSPLCEINKIVVMHLPTISIVSGLYNTDLDLWENTLTAIKQQLYPRGSIEHIVMDAGSTNGGVELARSYGCTVIKRPDLINKGSVRMSLGIKRAKGHLILLLEPDNIIIGRNWLREMVMPFVERPDVVAAFSMYNAFSPTMPALTKYCALIGANDPTLLYLGKSEKMPWYEKHYGLGEILDDRPTYLVVRFTKNNLPTLGDNGHMVRRKDIQKVNINPNTFLHIDAFANLLDAGFDTYAVVKNSIVHHTGASIIDLVVRRSIYKYLYYDKNRGRRSYYVYDPDSPKDKKNMVLYVLFALTIVQPLFLSIRGYLSVPEGAWFLHPVVCFCMVVGYGWSEINYRLRSLTWGHI